MDFDAWIERLSVDVIQGEYGFEENEFTVFPEVWQPYYDEGLSPEAAFRRALHAYDQRRREEETAARANWARIQAEDARLLAKDQG